MKISIGLVILFISTLSLTGRDKITRKGMIITHKDTIDGFLDISTDFNYQVYYKTDSTKKFFKKVKSKHLVKVLYEDKTFEWVPYKMYKIMCLNMVEGTVSLYADFLPSITPSNNSSMLTSTQSNKTMKVYYLQKGGETYELTTKNFTDIINLVFADKPEIYLKMEGLSYRDLFDQLPDLTAKYNQH